MMVSTRSYSTAVFAVAALIQGNGDFALGGIGTFGAIILYALLNRRGQSWAP